MSPGRSNGSPGSIFVEPAPPERQLGVTLTSRDYLILREGSGGTRLDTQMFTCLGIGVSCALSALALHAAGQYFNGHEPVLKTFVFTVIFWAGAIVGLAVAALAWWDRRHVEARQTYGECRKRIETTLRLAQSDDGH
jgi:hypothetical protein